MKITVNGQSRDADSGISLANYLKQLDLDPERLAIERNREIVSRAELETTILQPEDQIEIIQFVGGG